MNQDAYGHVPSIGKAIGNGNRLELLELMAEAEQSVEDMARMAGMGVTSVSSHLQVLKNAGLVRTRRDGVRIYFRLAGPEVAALFLSMKDVAARFLPAQIPAESATEAGSSCEAVPLIRTIDETLDAFMLDVRPAHEYLAGHYPGAVSIPLDDLASRMDELPRDRRVIVYCRGEFCLLARDAARLMRTHGIDACAMDEGVLEWRAGGSVGLTATA